MFYLFLFKVALFFFINYGCLSVHITSLLIMTMTMKIFSFSHIYFSNVELLNDLVQFEIVLKVMCLRSNKIITNALNKLTL